MDIIKQSIISPGKGKVVNISKLEKIISLAAFLTIWVLLAMYGSGPVYSDQLLYVDMGLNNIQSPNHGNRYFHVYLQKLFMALAPSPMVGTRIFWGFLIALTGLLVYWNARSFFKHSNPLHGLLAVLFFLSNRFLSEHCGQTQSDVTGMAMVTVLLSVYLFYVRGGRKHTWSVIALGALFFLSFKTKETTLTEIVILLGLLFDENGKFSLKNGIPLIKPFLMGLAGAVGLFILMDSVFLHNPFFSISPQTITAVLENYAYTPGFRREPSSYYGYLLTTLMVPFLLYLLSGVKRYEGRDDSPALKVVWLFPLALTVWMTLTMLKIPWGFIERFFFPALPTIAILAPQFLDFEWPKHTKEKVGAWGLLLLGIGAIWVMRSSFIAWTDQINWDYARFLDSIFYPIVVSLLLGMILCIRKFKWLNGIIAVVCILALMVAPLMHNQKYIFRTSFTGAVFHQVYYPFITYQAHIHYFPGMQMFFSANVSSETEMLSDNRDELKAMFNAYFNGRTDGDNYTIEWDREKIPQEISAQRFDYVLLNQADWEMVEGSREIKEAIDSMYQVVADPDQQVVLLVGK